MSESDGRLFEAREAKLLRLFGAEAGGVAREVQIARLVAALDDEDSVVAEEAQAELVGCYAVDCVEALLRAAPSFAPFGKLCAIEVFQVASDPRAAAVVTPWLEDEAGIVQAWTAELLADHGAIDAIPALQRAWEASKEKGYPPDAIDPSAFRGALEALGARRGVMPDAVARLGQTHETLGRYWTTDELEPVLEALYDASQVVLDVSFWTKSPHTEGDHWYGDQDTRRSARLDWSSPWHELIAESRRQVAAPAIDSIPRLEPPVAITIW